MKRRFENEYGSPRWTSGTYQARLQGLQSRKAQLSISNLGTHCLSGIHRGFSHLEAELARRFERGWPSVGVWRESCMRILMDFAMSAGGGARSALRRTGKLLILRLTPRLLRRWARGGTRSSRISSRIVLCSTSLSRGGNGAEERQFGRTIRTACRNDSRSGSSSTLEAASCMRPRTAKCDIIRPKNSCRTNSYVLLRKAILAPRR
jgi:hypothetical protein